MYASWKRWVFRDDLNNAREVVVLMSKGSTGKTMPSQFAACWVDLHSGISMSEKACNFAVVFSGSLVPHRAVACMWAALLFTPTLTRVAQIQVDNAHDILFYHWTHMLHQWCSGVHVHRVIIQGVWRLAQGLQCTHIHGRCMSYEHQSISPKYSRT